MLRTKSWLLLLQGLASVVDVQELQQTITDHLGCNSTMKYVFEAKDQTPNDGDGSSGGSSNGRHNGKDVAGGADDTPITTTSSSSSHNSSKSSDNNHRFSSNGNQTFSSSDSSQVSSDGHETDGSMSSSSSAAASDWRSPAGEVDCMASSHKQQTPDGLRHDKGNDNKLQNTNSSSSNGSNGHVATAASEDNPRSNGTSKASDGGATAGQHDVLRFDPSDIPAGGCYSGKDHQYNCTYLSACQVSAQCTIPSTSV